MRNELEWDEFKTDVSTQAMELVEKLNAIGEFKYGESLLTRLETFDKTFVILKDDLADNSDIEIFDNDNAIATRAENAVMPETTFIPVEGQFYGLPSGAENIASADLGAELKVISLINKERRKQGMQPLEWDEALTRACRYHAYDLATQNYFNHDTYDRKNGKLVKVGGTFDRIKVFYNESLVNAENIAAGNATGEATYEQWFESKGHYDAMFDPDSKRVGIGVFFDENSPFGYYWAFCTAL